MAIRKNSIVIAALFQFGLMPTRVQVLHWLARLIWRCIWSPYAFQVNTGPEGEALGPFEVPTMIQGKGMGKRHLVEAWINGMYMASETDDHVEPDINFDSEGQYERPGKGKATGKDKGKTHITRTDVEYYSGTGKGQRQNPFTR